MNTITAEQLRDLLERQERTNAAYTGADWRSSMNLDKLKVAIMDEASEFLREVKPTWKWWDGNAVMEREKGLFEAVDLMHFMLTWYLKSYYSMKDGKPHAWFTEDLDKAVESANKVSALWEGSNEIPLRHFSKTFFSMMSYDCAFMNSILLVQTACCKILGYTGEQFYQAYILKNDRNLERAAKGVMRGVDVKSTEQELHLA